MSCYLKTINTTLVCKTNRIVSWGSRGNPAALFLFVKLSAKGSLIHLREGHTEGSSIVFLQILSKNLVKVGSGSKSCCPFLFVKLSAKGSLIHLREDHTEGSSIVLLQRLSKNIVIVGSR